MCVSIIEDLIQNNCVRIGNFKLKNGETSKYYFDMKNLISYPKLLKTIGDNLYNSIKDLDFNLICGVPLGALPIATYISTNYNIPMIMFRDEVKSYGTNKKIEGSYKDTDKCIIIEDVITSGSSVENVINILKDKVNIVGIGVILNRQQGYECKYPLKSVITKTDIVRERLKKIMKEKNSRLCFSADLDDCDKLLKMLDDVGKYIVICKIHYDFYNDNDDFKIQLIELSIKHNFLIMEDRKFVDISSTVKKQYKKFYNWVDLITVMGNVNKTVVENLSCVLLVANMSNNDYDYSERCLEISNEYGKNMIGFITQKRLENEKMICMTPGINLKSNGDKDQKYRNVDDVDTDILIVGRGIYNDANYRDACIEYSKL